MCLFTFLLAIVIGSNVNIGAWFVGFPHVNINFRILLTLWQQIFSHLKLNTENICRCNRVRKPDHLPLTCDYIHRWRKNRPIYLHQWKPVVSDCNFVYHFWLCSVVLAVLTQLSADIVMCFQISAAPRFEDISQKLYHKIKNITESIAYYTLNRINHGRYNKCKCVDSKAIESQKSHVTSHNVLILPIFTWAAAPGWMQLQVEHTNSSRSWAWSKHPRSPETWATPYCRTLPNVVGSDILITSFRAPW